MMGLGKLETLTSIVAIDLRGAIGCDNSLPWRLGSDMAFFREQTIGNSVIMGRKTYDSLGGRPLPKRSNIVLSHNNVLFDSTPSCQLALSVDEALFRAAYFDDEEAFIIGGAQTYEQFDQIVDRYLLTVVDHKVPNADTFLSPMVLNSLQNWERREIASFPAVSGQDEFAFSVYELCAPDVAKRRVSRLGRIEAFNAKFDLSKKTGKQRRRPSELTQDAFAF